MKDGHSSPTCPLCVYVCMCVCVCVCVCVCEVFVCTYECVSKIDSTQIHASHYVLTDRVTEKREHQGSEARPLWAVNINGA